MMVQLNKLFRQIVQYIYKLLKRQKQLKIENQLLTVLYELLDHLVLVLTELIAIAIPLVIVFSLIHTIITAVIIDRLQMQSH